MKRLIAGLMVVAMAEAVSASTVAYWPLAGENGVRTTVADVFPNIASPGTMDAVPVSIKTGGTGVEDGVSTYCPIGTNAFPSAYGVYDPVAGVNRTAARADGQGVHEPQPHQGADAHRPLIGKGVL